MLCKLTPEEEVRMHILLKGIADDPNALEMQRFIQHGSVTTYEHCLRVTRIAFWLNIHLHARADETSLVKGAFLHDFYLYDWHNCSNITHWHGFKHARIARYNAETVFKLTDKEKADYHNTNTWDILVQGKPYAINKTDDDMYGKNTAQTSVSTDYEPDKEIYKQSDNAIIMGYLIDFRAGYQLQTENGSVSEKLYYDYSQSDNNTPNRGLFRVKLFNQDKQNATGQEAAARIDSAANTNTMDSR